MSRTDPIPELKRLAGAQIAELLDGWNAHDAAVLLRTDQPRISDLRRGRLERFSLETLIRFLTHLGRRVDLSITEIPRRFGRR